VSDRAAIIKLLLIIKVVTIHVDRVVSERSKLKLNLKDIKQQFEFDTGLDTY
jgi:hypothetical protein